MNLISITFILFAIITIFVYFIVPKKIQWLVLSLASFIFLFYNNLKIETIIQALIVLLSSYTFGLLIHKHRGKKRQKFYLILGILIILGQLTCLKYNNFFLTLANNVFNLMNINYHFNPTYYNSLIGISYYSLIMISYLVDVYCDAIKPQKNILKLALFMSYFPILTSGPIIKYEEVEKTLYKKNKFDYHRMCSGLLRIVWGVFKILVISQRIAIFVNTVYADLNSFNGVFTIIAMLLYTIQLYTNFSGSIDIIMGVSEIIGIDLPENFNGPFFSRTITDFWRRWHITLGNWLRNYIFYPILKSDIMQKLTSLCKKLFGHNIGKRIPVYISLLIMWTLIGMWHGGLYTIIIGSGLLQFVYMFLEDVLEPVAKKINKKLKINSDTFSYHLFQTIRTYLLFSFSMIFFRAPSLSQAQAIIKAMFIWNPWVLFDRETLYTAGLDIYDFRVLIVAIIALFVVEYLGQNGSVREKLFNQNIIFRWGIIYLLLFAIIIFGFYGVGYDPATFIYRQF